MDWVKECSRRSLFWIIFVLGLLCILTDLGFLYLLKVGAVKMVDLSTPYATLPEMQVVVRKVAVALDLLRIYFIPVSAGIFVVFGLLLWLMLRLSFGRLARTGEVARIKPKPEKAKTAKPDPEAEKAQRIKERRLFIHLLAALQRDGRLMDFLAEDLDEYEDDQIGAAVRSIHENCNGALEKYIQAGPVVDAAEETELTVPPDFDPAAIKLTGNVTGEPPFTGIVRHRGWRAKRLEMPTLSATRDPDIIAPAEVEIP